MPACHALPPAPTYHASRHAPLFFPPVRYDTSGPIITSPSHPQVGAQSRGASNEFIFLVFKISDDKPSFLESKDSSTRSRRCCLHKSKSPPQRARSPPRPFGRPHVTPAPPPTRGSPTCAPWHAPCLAPDRSLYPRSPAAPSPTPGQELCANPSTYKGPPGGYRYLLVALRSEPPRGLGGEHHVRSAGSRAVRNESHRTVVRGPIGPCRSTLVHVCDAVRVPICIVKLG